MKNADTSNTYPVTEANPETGKPSHAHGVKYTAAAPTKTLAIGTTLNTARTPRGTSMSSPRMWGPTDNARTPKAPTAPSTKPHASVVKGEP